MAEKAKIKINSEDFRVPTGKKVKLKEWATSVKPFCETTEGYKDLLEEHVEELSSLQQLHYASNRYALLLIFQGMDAAGKDGAIRHVMSGVNPQGCEVFSFKQPSAEELEHDFLWRTTRRLPERGRIGMFNRSYYEEVFRKNCATTKPSGRAGIAPSWIWKVTFIAMARRSSKYFSTFLRRSSESDSWRVSMSPTRTGNSASQTFTRGSTGRITSMRMRLVCRRQAPITHPGTLFPPTIRRTLA